MPRPPDPKFWAGLAQIGNQFPQPYIIAIPVTQRPETRDTSPGSLFPVGITLALLRIHERGPDDVAFTLRKLRIIAEELPGALIPRDHIQSAIDQLCRIDKRVKNSLIGGGWRQFCMAHHFWLRNWSPRQVKQMAALFGCQLQNVREPGEKLI